MIPRWTVIAFAAALTACSGSSGDSSPSDSSPITDAPTATDDSPDSTPVSTDDVEADPPDTDPPVTDPPDTDPPVTDPPATDPALVIDGPATVIESCESLPRGVTEFVLDAGGAPHPVRIYVPETVVSDPVPTVLNWHGLGSNGIEQALLSGYETLAEQEGFVVVHPTGVPAGDDDRNSWELPQGDLPERDDLAFADALIDEVVSDWCADPDRIYSTGFSNGGYFTSELVCNRSERIAAAASVAGTNHFDTCDPERPVPYIAFHGTDDDVVPFDGGESTLEGDVDTGGLLDQVIPEEFAEFAADAGCSAEPDRTEISSEVIRYDYLGCDGDVPMAFYELPGSGHTWPNSPLADALADIGFFTKDIDATVDGWAFMSQHTL